MDFKKIQQSTPYYNFHSHTQFCDGRASMREMAVAAVQCGMKHYGFSPHSPIPIPSTCNMSADSVDEYISEANRIKNDESLSACRFYTGMEVDYIDESWGPSADYFRALNLDYVIGSVHFIPTQSGELVDIDGRFEKFKNHVQDRFRGDIEYVVDTFYRRSHAMIDAGGFDILGHFDKIGQNAGYYAAGIEDSEFYKKLVGALIDNIIDKNLVIELNTKARKEHGRFFPGQRYLRRLIDAGVTILVNSDAHYPDRIDASRAEAIDLLKTLGYAHA